MVRYIDFCSCNCVTFLQICAPFDCVQNWEEGDGVHGAVDHLPMDCNWIPHPVPQRVLLLEYDLIETHLLDQYAFQHCHQIQQQEITKYV